MGRECQTEAKALKMHPRKCCYEKFTQVSYLQKTNVLPGWRDALDRRHYARSQCVRSQGVQSIARNWSEFPRRSELAMAARATRETQVYMEYARSLIICSIAEALDHQFLGLESRNAQTCLWSLTRRALDHTNVRSIILAGTPNFTLSQFHPCNYGMNAMTCNNIKH